MELSAVFIIMGLVAVIIMGTKLNRIGEEIATGFKDAAMAAMMIGIVRVIFMVLNEGKITDTIVYECPRRCHICLRNFRRSQC